MFGLENYEGIHGKKVVGKPDYSEFYDKELIDKVYKIYRDDVINFGYEFEEQ